MMLSSNHNAQMYKHHHDQRAEGRYPNPQQNDQRGYQDQYDHYEDGDELEGDDSMDRDPYDQRYSSPQQPQQQQQQQQQQQRQQQYSSPAGGGPPRGQSLQIDTTRSNGSAGGYGSGYARAPGGGAAGLVGDSRTGLGGADDRMGDADESQGRGQLHQPGGQASQSALQEQQAQEADQQQQQQQVEEDEEEYASSEGMPDEDINFTLHYALHTFIATVEGQASVMKGDSLILLDDTNSYWWLVKVLKTEDVGYIPAENIETPFERLARLNKYRNVDLAAATMEERHQALLQSHVQAQIHGHDQPGPGGKTLMGSLMNPMFPSQARQATPDQDDGKRRVIFAEPTYVDHPGKTWSDTSGEDDDEGMSEDGMGEGEEGLDSADEVDEQTGDGGRFADDESEDDFGTEEGMSSRDGMHVEAGTASNAAMDRSAEQVRARGTGGETPDRYEDAPVGSTGDRAGPGVNPDDMEPDDGMEWDDTAVREERERRRRLAEAQQRELGVAAQVASNGPGANSQIIRARSGSVAGAQRPMINQSPAHHDRQEQTATLDTHEINGSPVVEQAKVRDEMEPKRITVTPAVARGPEPSSGMGRSPGQVGTPTGPSQDPHQAQRYHQQQQQQQQQQQPQQQQYRQSPGQQQRTQAQDPRMSVGPGQALNGQARPGGQLQHQPREREASGASSLGGTSIATQSSLRSMSVSPEAGMGRDEDEFGRRTGKKDNKNREENGSVKKKRSGVFSGLFGKKKDKDKKSKEDRPGSGTDAGSATSFESERQSHDYVSRLQDSPDIRREGPPQHGRVMSPPGRVHTDIGSAFQPPTFASGSGQNSPSAVSPQGIRLQQIDQQQQALYQQYMARSPGSSPPVDASKAYGTQAAAAVAQSSAAQRLARATGSYTGARPGSIILNPANTLGGPLLNVLRIFSGEHVETQFTFKTVLLNDSTTAQDLVKQALQRFRVDNTRDADLDNYFLTIKEVGGEELALVPSQKPLQAFNQMCERIGEEQDALTKTVKRSSVGSISSVSSNLSLHPAIAKLSMNDFSDDSNVKLFLNRRPRATEPTSYFENYGPPAINGVSNAVPLHESQDSRGGIQRDHKPAPIETNGHPEMTTVASPSARFTLHIMVEIGDLPDGMMFDPQSEAILPKTVVRERTTSSRPPQGPPVEARQRYLLLSRSSTVAEGIESALERFGIPEGVVDGGDDVEDKVGKRRSMLRVRYGLGVRNHRGEERMLHASSKLIDAYESPPSFKVADKTVTNRRRSREWARELSASEHDLRPTDPIFFLRRIGPRTAGLASIDKHPMDEVALKQRRLSDATSAETHAERAKTPQEIIAEQRAATKARQTAILTTHPNAEQGIDVVVADRGVVRSSRNSLMGQDEVRYSYISEDGETFDISQYVHDEWLDVEEDADARIEELRSPAFERTQTDQSVYRTAPSTPMEAPVAPAESSRFSTASLGNDLLHTIVQKSEQGAGQEYMAEKIDRVINKVHANRLQPARNTPTPLAQLQSFGQSLSSIPEDRFRDQRSASPMSEGYGESLRGTTMSPQLDPIPTSIRQAVEEAPSRSGSRQATHSPSLEGTSRQPYVAGKLPMAIRAASGSRHQRAQPSIASILSDVSGSGRKEIGTVAASSNPVTTRYAKSANDISRSWPKPKVPVKNKDDFGFGTLLGVINAKADLARPAKVDKPPLNPIDKRWFQPTLTAVQISQLSPAQRQDYNQKSKKIDDLENETAELMKRILALRARERKDRETEKAREAKDLTGAEVTNT